jgi:glycosyltransferase involved in cell wall biosynthesis
VVDEVTGFIRPAEDEAGLREAMGELLKNAERRRAMGRAARTHIERTFSVERCSQRLVDTYKRLLVRRGKGAHDV